MAASSGDKWSMKLKNLQVLLIYTEHLSRSVAQTGTKANLWSRFVPPTGTKGGHWSRFVAPTGTNVLGLPKPRCGGMFSPTSLAEERLTCL